MTKLPSLSEKEIRRWVGDVSFQRGMRYAHRGRVQNPRRTGMTLKGHCEGSMPLPYQVWVKVGDEGPEEGFCSCPVGEGGHCKHAAALMLTWVEEPGNFPEVEDVATTLQQRSKEALIELVQQMIERHPELELMLELPSPSSDLAPVQPEVIQRQVAYALAGPEWEQGHGPHETITRLRQIVRVGDHYARAGMWASAVTVWDLILRGIWERDYTISEQIEQVLDETVSGLRQALDMLADPDLRERILRVLFDLFKWDLEFGGVDVEERAEDVLLHGSTAEEREMISGWVRVAAANSREWTREALGGLLLQLEGAEADDETFLRICRETGRRYDLIDRLLYLGRIEDAIREVKQTGDYALLALADLFVGYGHLDEAEQLVRERVAGNMDTRMVDWLRKHAEERGDLDEALQLAEQLFWAQPTPLYYEDVKQLAEQKGSWERLRADLLSRLAETRQWGLLVQIHLLDGEVAEALDTLPQAVRSTRWWDGGSLSLQVAQAAEGTHPRESIRLYESQADRLIAGRGRGNYADAAALLARVRDLYGRLDEMERWREVITELRERHRTLRALQDELNQAGL